MKPRCVPESGNDQTKPLREVFAELVKKGAQLRILDDKISMAIAALERRFRSTGVTRIFSVKLPDGADLGWSMHRRSKRWRFVIRVEDDAWELMSCSAEERAEVFACGAMRKLVTQIQEAVR
jgi:hypothetical protein